MRRCMLSGGGTGTFIPGSTAWKRTCFSRRVKEIAFPKAKRKAKKRSAARSTRPCVYCAGARQPCYNPISCLWAAPPRFDLATGGILPSESPTSGLKTGSSQEEQPTWKRGVLVFRRPCGGQGFWGNGDH